MMKQIAAWKYLMLLFAVNVLSQTLTAQIAAWNNNALSGTTTGNLNATTNDANLNVPVLSRGSGILASSLTGGYASSNWVDVNEAAAITNSRYYQVTLSAKTAYKVSLATLDAKLRRSSTGPNAYIWRYSTDGTNFTDIGTATSFTTSTSSGDVQSQISLSGITALQNVTSANTVTLRLYAWGGSSSGGTLAFGTGNVNSLAFGGTVANAISSNATLSNLSLSGGVPLSPSFDPTVTDYTASVSNSISSITITPTASDGGATIKVGINTVPSGTASPAIDLAVGENTIATVVTASDGTTTNNYTVKVTRAAVALPSLSATTLSAFGNVCVTQTAGPNSFSISGSNLDGSNISVSALTGYAFAESAAGPYTPSLSFSAGTSLANKLVYVRFTPTAAQAYNGTITVSGGGSSGTSVSASGTGVSTPGSVTTGASSAITASSATLSATNAAGGCGTISGYGVEYSTSTGFADGAGTKVPASGLSSGSFSASLSGLSYNTTYFYKAYVTTENGTFYGAQQSFITTAIPVQLSAQEDLTYKEDFSTLSSWVNGFTGNAAASHFGGLAINTTGSIPSATRITTASTSFSSGTSGGVQKGTGNIALLSTGGTDNSSSTAFDLYLDFTGLNAGTLSFDWATVFNSTGDRNGSLLVYATTNGTSFTQIASVLNVTNNVTANGTVNVTLPASFNNSPTARLRFYYYNGTGGTSGSRPKISIDNLSVTAISTTPCATPSAQPTDLTFGTPTETVISGSFTAASPAPNKYLVVVSQNNSLTSGPVDGQVYEVGDNLGDGDVVAYSSSTNFTATGLSGGSTYTFFVFAVNNACAGGPKYLAVNPLQGDATTITPLPTCAPPAAQPMGLALTAKTTSVAGTFTATTADEYLVVRSTDASLTALPKNGFSYGVGQALGNGTVVSKGPLTNFTARGLTPNTPYTFFVFAIGSQNCVNGPAYNTTDPLTASVSTLQLSPCAPPAAQPTNLNLNAGNTSITGSFNESTTADHYVVIASTANTLTAQPTDGTDYVVGDAIGGGKVVASGSTTSFVASGLTAATTYNLFVFAANRTCTGGTKYLTASPLLGTTTTTATPAYTVYFGNLHAHSDYSDGNKDHPGYTPADDYKYAMTAECMDFLGISEHNHFSSPDNPGNLVTNYHQGSVQADTFSAAHPGFLALYGMEWGVISGGGHVVVYGDGMDKLFGWESNVGGLSGNNYDVFVAKSDYTGPNGLFKTVNDYAAQNTFATLAHPNNTDYNNISNSPYNSVADDAIVGSAVESGPATSTNTTYSNPGSSMAYLWYFNKMLSLGYHLGPVMDHDNHNTTFGKTTRARTAVLATALTKTEIVKAMHEMRFYATEDCDAKVDFTVNNRVMGSQFSDRNAPSISVRLSDATTQTSSAKIRILYGIPGSGALPVAIDSTIGSSFDLVDNNLPVNATGYYYAEITNGSAHIVTSPVWYTRTCGYETDTIAKACQSFDWYGTTYTSSITTSRHFTTAVGCDSLVTLHLSVYTPNTRDTTAKVCEQFTWFGTAYTESGDYTHVLKNEGGCDSTLTLHLTIYQKPDATITASGATTFCPGGSVTLNAPAAASYQWSTGASTQSINVTASGDYSVTITDANTCTATSSTVTVTAEDHTPPTVNTKNITVNLDANGSVTITPSQVDNGSTDGCGIPTTGYSLDKSSFNCGNIGQNTVTLTVTDNNGNQASATAVVTVVDNTAPVVNTRNVTVYLDAAGNASVSPAQINNGSTDNCAIEEEGYSLDKTGFTCGDLGANTVTLTVTDKNGNTASGTATVIVVDNTAPIVKTKPLTVSLDATGSVTITPAQVNNGSADNCGIHANGYSLDKSTFSCADLGANTVTLTVTDGSGNAASATAAVTVVDNTAPTVRTKALTVNLDASGKATITAAQMDDGSTDNCSIPVSGYGLNKTSFTCSDLGANTVTLTVTDASGNSASSTAIVTVRDVNAPVPNSTTLPDLTGECSVTVAAKPTATDACAGTVTATTTDPLVYSEQGTYTITWRYNDGHGNTSSQTQTVIVKDVTKPVITSCPTVPVFCYNTNGTYTIPAIAATDNCGMVKYSYVITGATNRSGTTANASGAFGVGTSAINWTVDDGNGNTSTCTTTVKVNSPISASVPDVYAVNPGGAANTIYQGYGPTSLTLNTVVSGGTPPYSYKWTVGSSAGQGLSTAASYAVSPATTTTYYLNVKDVYGCSVVVVTKTIKVVDVRCGPKLDKVTVCTQQKSGYTTSCVTSNSVASYLSSGGYLGTCASTASTTKAGIDGSNLMLESPFALTAMPNPSRDQFTLKVSSGKLGETIRLVVVDAVGKLVETKIVQAGQTVQLGTLYRPGIYFCTAEQGDKRTTIKLVKVSE